MDKYVLPYSLALSFFFLARLSSFDIFSALANFASQYVEREQAFGKQVGKKGKEKASRSTVIVRVIHSVFIIAHLDWPPCLNIKGAQEHRG